MLGAFSECTLIELTVIASKVTPVGTCIEVYFEDAAEVAVNTPSPFLAVIVKLYAVLAKSPVLAQVLVLIQLLFVFFVVFLK